MTGFFSEAAHPRGYTVSELARDLRWVVTQLPSSWAIWVRGRLPAALREQVIVAVAQVNACRMCEHAHSRMALQAGVSDAELAALQEMDEVAFDRRTWLALSYARERVKAGFAPLDANAKAPFVEALGTEICRDVEVVAHVMTVANRVANTLDALADRLHGKPRPHSRLVDELVINVLFLPGAWIGILVAAVRQGKSPLAVWRQARGLPPEA